MDSPGIARKGAREDLLHSEAEEVLQLVSSAWFRLFLRIRVLPSVLSYGSQAQTLIFALRSQGGKGFCNLNKNPKS